MEKKLKQQSIQGEGRGGGKKKNEGGKHAKQEGEKKKMTMVALKNAERLVYASEASMHAHTYITQEKKKKKRFLSPQKSSLFSFNS